MTVDEDVEVAPGTEGGLLSLEGVTVRYGAATAVRSLDLLVHPGEIVALVGPIGAGKSSTFAAAMGLHRASQGRVSLAGADITSEPTHRIVRRGVALVPERRRLFADLTVEENLRLGAGPRQAPADDRDLVFELFPILRERIRAKAGFLSGGEAQQLAIARALVSGPRLMLLDEPSLGLAPQITETMFELLPRLRDDRGLTILLAEQNVFQALEVADRGYVIRGGAIETGGEAAHLLSEPEALKSYLGVAGPQEETS